MLDRKTNNLNEDEKITKDLINTSENYSGSNSTSDTMVVVSSSLQPNTNKSKLIEDSYQANMLIVSPNANSPSCGNKNKRQLNEQEYEDADADPDLDEEAEEEEEVEEEDEDVNDNDDEDEANVNHDNQPSSSTTENRKSSKLSSLSIKSLFKRVSSNVYKKSPSNVNGRFKSELNKKLRHHHNLHHDQQQQHLVHTKANKRNVSLNSSKEYENDEVTRKFLDSSQSNDTYTLSRMAGASISGTSGMPGLMTINTYTTRTISNNNTNNNSNQHTFKRNNNYLYFNYNNNKMNYFNTNVEYASDMTDNDIISEFNTTTHNNNTNNNSVSIRNQTGKLSINTSPVLINSETIAAISSLSSSTPTQITPVSSTTKCSLNQPTVNTLTSNNRSTNVAHKRLSGTEV